MVTISLQLPDELAERLQPLQNRLPEIIELGLRQLEVQPQAKAEANALVKARVLAAFQTVEGVTLPQAMKETRTRYTPINAGGPPASELIIKERHGK